MREQISHLDTIEDVVQTNKTLWQQHQTQHKSVSETISLQATFDDEMTVY